MPRQHRYGALTHATSVPMLCGVIEPFYRGERRLCREKKARRGRGRTNQWRRVHLGRLRSFEHTGGSKPDERAAETGQKA